MANPSKKNAEHIEIGLELKLKRKVWLRKETIMMSTILMETQLIVVGKIFQSVIKAVTDLLLELRQGGKNINVQELY
jgi:hypothetical protein